MNSFDVVTGTFGLRDLEGLYPCSYAFPLIGLVPELVLCPAGVISISFFVFTKVDPSVTRADISETF